MESVVDPNSGRPTVIGGERRKISSVQEEGGERGGEAAAAAAAAGSEDQYESKTADRRMRGKCECSRE